MLISWMPHKSPPGRLLWNFIAVLYGANTLRFVTICYVMWFVITLYEFDVTLCGMSIALSDFIFTLCELAITFCAFINTLWGFVIYLYWFNITLYNLFITFCAFPNTLCGHFISLCHYRWLMPYMYGRHVYVI